MSIRKIKRRHYRLLKRARVFDWGMDALMKIMVKGQKTLAQAVHEAICTGESALQITHESRGIEFVEVDIRKSDPAK